MSSGKLGDIFSDMRSPPPALLPILRSQVAGDLLALLYLHPEAEYSLTEAAMTIGAPHRASVIVGTRPGRDSSASPSRRLSIQRLRHFPTVSS